MENIGIREGFERDIALQNQLNVPLLAELRTDYDMADWTYKKIMERIKEFQDELDSEHEIGIMLANFGQSLIMAVEDVGYQNPNLLYFYGTINGKEAQLIQHMNQLNFVLTSAARQPDRPARRIGFAVEQG